MSASPDKFAEPPRGDQPARRRSIRGSLWFTVPGTYAVLGAAYWLAPPLAGLSEPSERLILAVRWLLVAFTPYAAVCLIILYQRYAEGAHNPLLGEESERLRIHCRVMQNTLEQLLWFALCILPLATLVAPSQARLIPILCVFFAFARFVYWWGYFRRGTLGRTLGVQFTFLLNIALFVLVSARFARSLLS
jgi:uncharacterized membrane protein YecN with MAPEG domain